MLFRPSHLRNYIRRKLAFKGSPLIHSAYEGAYPGQEELLRAFESYLTANGIRKEQIHTSGHAFEEHLRRLADELRPKNLIPIHTCHPGEYPNVFKGHRVLELKDGEPFEF